MNTGTGKKRIVLAEDSALLRESLVGMLERFEFEVVGQAGDATELIEAVDRLGPDLVITDVRMPPEQKDEGIRAALELRARHPGLAVLVLSQYVEQEYAADLLVDGRGAVGYLLKDRVADVRSLVDSLREILSGGTVVDPEVVRGLLRSGRDRRLDSLTERELETLGLMAEGHSNGAIAERLVITEATVGKHIGNVFEKLELPPDAGSHRRVLAVLTYLRDA